MSESLGGKEVICMQSLLELWKDLIGWSHIKSSIYLLSTLLYATYSGYKGYHEHRPLSLRKPEKEFETLMLLNHCYREQHEVGKIV